jgi:hypothetical protein
MCHGAARRRIPPSEAARRVGDEQPGESRNGRDTATGPQRRPAGGLGLNVEEDMSVEPQEEGGVPRGGRGSHLRGWLIPILIGLLFLGWGLAVFWTVGDKGPPAWDFGAVQDIPGQSPYSTEPRDAPAPVPQHVDR